MFERKRIVTLHVRDALACIFLPSQKTVLSIAKYALITVPLELHETFDDFLPSVVCSADC